MTTSNYVVGQCQNCNASYCIEEKVFHDDTSGRGWRTIDGLQMCCSESDIITDIGKYGIHRIKTDLGYECIQLSDNKDPIVWSDVIIGNELKKPSRFDLLDMDGDFDKPKPEPESEPDEDKSGYKLCEECSGEGKVLDGPDPTSWYTCSECLGTGRIKDKEKIDKHFICQKCKGEGKIFDSDPDVYEWVNCNECGGSGRRMIIRRIPSSDIDDPPSDWAGRGITHAIYDYHNHPDEYCGDGNALIKKNDQWYNHNMGHCSCNGPWENTDLENPIANKLVEIRHKVSKECWEGIKELVKMALVCGWS